MVSPYKTSNPKLALAVIRTVGRDYIEDLARHGADAGFPGITYYTDTVRFWKRHRMDIMALAEESASQLGEGGVVSMVGGFRCLKGYSESEICRALYQGKGDGGSEDVILNAMTWFACEEMARQLCPDI